MDTQQKNTKKSKRTRSPDYPQYTLEECIKFLGMFVKANGGFNAEAHMDVAVESMGHSTKSSTAIRVVASMQHYGLFDVRGSGADRFFQPSDLAGEIYKANEQSPERIKALQTAALNPSAMQTVWEKWGPNIPSEPSLRKSLEVEFSFSNLGAKRFSTVATENYQYARLAKNGKIEPETEADSKSDERPQGKVDMSQTGGS